MLVELTASVPLVNVFSSVSVGNRQSPSTEPSFRFAFVAAVCNADAWSCAFMTFAAVSPERSWPSPTGVLQPDQPRGHIPHGPVQVIAPACPIHRARTRPSPVRTGHSEDVHILLDVPGPSGLRPPRLCRYRRDTPRRLPDVRRPRRQDHGAAVRHVPAMRAVFALENVLPARTSAAPASPACWMALPATPKMFAPSRMFLAVKVVRPPRLCRYRRDSPRRLPRPPAPASGSRRRGFGMFPAMPAVFALENVLPARTSAAPASPLAWMALPATPKMFSPSRMFPAV